MAIINMLFSPNCIFFARSGSSLSTWLGRYVRAMGMLPAPMGSTVVDNVKNIYMCVVIEGYVCYKDSRAGAILPCL